MMFYGLPVGTVARRLCAHNCVHGRSGEQLDGTYIDTCTRCGARWAVWPSGRRVRTEWER
jgi:hypothetical protein